MAYHRSHGVATRIVRSSTPTAQGCAPRRPRGVQLLHPGPGRRPLTLYGDGTQTRSFSYVADTVDGIVRLLGSAEVDPVKHREPTEFTIAGLVATLENVLGHPSPSLRAAPPGRPPGAPAGHHPGDNAPRVTPQTALEAGSAKRWRTSGGIELGETVTAEIRVVFRRGDQPRRVVFVDHERALTCVTTSNANL